MKSFNHIIFLLVALLSFTHCFSSSIELTGTWQFKPGDCPDWAQVDFPDSSWEYIGVPQIWETAGFRRYNGFAWYRKTIVIPKSWKNEKYLNLRQELLLDLGNIDDADQTFFNDSLIGATGSFPPQYQSRWNLQRHYSIPVDLVKWGEKNVIAIRVYDREGNGGIYAGAPRLKTPSAIDFCKINIHLDKSELLYQRGEPVLATAIIYNNSFHKITEDIEWIVQSDMGGIVDKQQQTFSVFVGRSKRIKNIFQLRKTGFYHVTCRLHQDDEVDFESTFTIGYAVENVKTKSTAKADFSTFWERTRNQLGLIPLQSEIDLIDSLSQYDRNVFSAQLLSFDNIYVYGWYSLPKRWGKYPALLIVQNEKASLEYENQLAFDDFAVLTLNIRGHGKSREEINPGFPGHMSWNIHDKEKYIYRGAVMDCIRALDFLCEQIQVDTSRLGIVGESLGGGLALATAALDSRINLVVADAPLLAAFPVATRIVSYSYSEIIQYIVEHPTEKNQVFDTLSYYDLINLAPKIQCPVFLSIGLQDKISPPRTIFLVYNRISSPKKYHIRPRAGHESGNIEHLQLKADWIKSNWSNK